MSPSSTPPHAVDVPAFSSSTPTLTSLPTRDDLLCALTFDDLASGRGTVRQQRAWQELEWRRCAASPLYFLDNYGWIRAKNGDIVRWELWPTQRALLEEWAGGESTVAIKARQLGITTLTIHFFLWKVMFKEAASCHVVSYSEDAAKDAMSRLRITLDRIPAWMLERARSQSKGEEERQDRQKGIKQITFGFSSLRILTSTPSAVAGKAGDFVLDEFSRHPDQKRVFDNIIPAFNGGGQLIVIANGQGEDEFFSIYGKAKCGDMPMRAHFFSWRDDPTRDDEWYEQTKRYYLRKNADADIFDFKAQYPSTEDEAFYISGNSRFDLGALQGFSLLMREMPAAKIGMLEPFGDGFTFHESGRAGRLRLYDPPVDGATYVIGVDPAGGGASSDYSVVQVCRLIQNDDALLATRVKLFGYDSPPLIDGDPAFIRDDTLASLEHVATYQARTEPAALAEIVRRLGEWYNTALVVVELNQHGGTVIDRLKGDYPNLYTEIRNEKFADEATERVGYWSDKHSKMEMIDSLAEWLHRGWILMRDSASITELSRYGYQITSAGNVRAGAPKGMNDDLVIGLALCVVGARSLIVRRSANPRRVFSALEW